MSADVYPNAELTRRIIAAAQAVHRELGSGFLESLYQAALYRELLLSGIGVVQQSPLQVMYRGATVGTFFADMLVEGGVICELKAVKALLPEHESQLIHYLKATDTSIGLLLNFGAPSLEVKRKIYSRNLRQSGPNPRNLR